MPRWTCPNNKHPTVIGPEKPRRDNLCRYCLDCSKVVGKLVERVAPALEAKRAVRTTKLKEQAQAKRQAAREKAQAYPQSLQLDFKRWARLKAWEVDLSNWSFELRVKGKSRNMVHATGHCYEGARRIVVTAGQCEDDARYTVLHELAHAAVFHASYRWRGTGSKPDFSAHGEVYRMYLKTAVEEVIGRRVIFEKPYTDIHEFGSELVIAIARWMKETSVAKSTPSSVQQEQV